MPINRLTAMDENDKRTSQRVPQNTPILFSRPNSGNQGGNLQMRYSATITDISSTGMGILTKAHITPGQLVDFVKDQPHWELPAKGLVVWCLKDGPRFRAGLEFVMDSSPLRREAVGC